MSKTQYAFISYSRRDEIFVNRLSQDLRFNGVEIWKDVDEILPGQNWEHAIKDALSNAVAYIYVSSKNSDSSIWMAEELRRFMSREFPVIPIIIDDEGVKNIPHSLKILQWVDFRDNYEKAFNFLLKALPKVVKHEQPVEAKTAKSKGYVFINYAEEDSNFVKDLKYFLQHRNYAYWDYEESERDYHTQLFRELEEVILNASATLSVVSPAWKESEWAPREYIFSRDSKVPVFLLLARETKPILIISGEPYIDFIKDINMGFIKLGKELQRKGL